MLSLARPDIGPLEVELVNRVLGSDTLSLGQMAVDFETALAGYVGAPHGVAVSSGTAGLHTLVRALGVGPGGEVVTSSFSFVATANAVLYEGAVPVFADIEPGSLGLDPGAVEAAITPRTKAILAVDVFGHPCRLPQLREIARRRGLYLIDDACEALGAAVTARDAAGGLAAPLVPVGHPSLADAAVFAFFPNKQVTTGEGGMIVTGDADLARLCRSLRNQGRGEGDRWLVHERLGFNYRLDEMSAAMGLAQVRRLDELLARRALVADLYRQRLAGLVGAGMGVELPAVAEGVTMSWFVYVIRLAPPHDRDAVARYLADRGVPTRPYFQPIHLQPFYRERFGYRGGELPVTEAAGRSGLALPFHGRMGPDEVDQVARALEAALAQPQARRAS